MRRNGERIDRLSRASRARGANVKSIEAKKVATIADIAQLGFAADTSALKDAKQSLDALSPATARAEKSSVKLSASLAKVDASADKLMSAATGLSSAVDKMAAVLNKSDAAAKTSAASYGSLNVAAGKTAVTFNMVGGAASTAATGLNSVATAADASSGKMMQLDAHVTAYRANLRQMKIDQMAAGSAMVQHDAHMVAYRDHLDRTGASGKMMGQAIKFGAVESLNASRQLADIGVTLASGMNPFMVALQQGPQLFDIIQNKAVMTGASIGTVFRAAGAAIWTALAPILPVIAVIAVAIGGIAAAFALGTREINKGNESVIAGLDLTEKQLQRVKKAGVDTSVTMGDTFKAFFGVIGERIAWLLSGPLKSLSDGWTKFLDYTMIGAEFWTKAIIASFVGAFFAIKASWSLLPKAMGDIINSAANGVISGIEWLINSTIYGLNALIAYADKAAAKVGLSGIGQIGKVSLGRGNNPYAGAAAEAGNAIAEGFKKGAAASDAAVDRFFDDVGKRARKNRKKLILDAAGDAEKGPKDKKKKKDKVDEVVHAKPSDFLDKEYDLGLKDNTLNALDQIKFPEVDEYFRQWHENIDAAKEAAKGFFDDWRQRVIQGENVFSAFGNSILGVLNKIINRLMDGLLNNLIDGMFANANGNSGGFLGKLFGNIGGGFATKGPAPVAARSPGIFSTPSISMTAKGDVFGAPTMFDFARGATSHIGQLGEAGPEAVIPLQRGPDGSLGVQSLGGGSGPAMINAPVTIHIDARAQGAISSKDIVDMQRRASEQTKAELARQIPSILQQYQLDGAMV